MRVLYGQWLVYTWFWCIVIGFGLAKWRHFLYLIVWLSLYLQLRVSTWFFSYAYPGFLRCSRSSSPQRIHYRGREERPRMQSWLIKPVKRAITFVSPCPSTLALLEDEVIWAFLAFVSATLFGVCRRHLSPAPAIGVNVFGTCVSAARSVCPQWNENVYSWESALACSVHSALLLTRWISR